ncbi:IS110 family RNA-guided transposase [Methylococcus mesophilus]|uniref:IS110 family transposase n=1 Tax=Methylococcus mesophilus TaxID=2993564 RepID=UPI00224A968F|nr:IS110 family transposase [Methylococcus mesophilus]UZR29553.1 IS110 family transposase [Methylococcus mesophilus]
MTTPIITTVGLDIAKHVIQVHAVDTRGKPVIRKALKRHQVLPFFANLPLCLIGIEACSGAHDWARRLTVLGHTVKLMAPQFVKPYVKANKHDAADAEAICEAVSRPSVCVVSIEAPEQQALLALHRARQGFVTARTAQANQIRGLLAGFGLVVPKGLATLKQRLPEILEDAENDLPGAFRELLHTLGAHLAELNRQVDDLTQRIEAVHGANPVSRRLAQIPGIGPLIATALLASIGDIRGFANGRQLAAWLGLVPKQSSTGGKTRLLGISKRGDTYLRTLLIHGARSALRTAQRRADVNAAWLTRLADRRQPNIAAVALAHKNVRIAFALLAHDQDYRPSDVPQAATA